LVCSGLEAKAFEEKGRLRSDANTVPLRAVKAVAVVEQPPLLALKQRRPTGSMQRHSHCRSFLAKPFIPDSLAAPSSLVTLFHYSSPSITCHGCVNFPRSTHQRSHLRPFQTQIQRQNLSPALEWVRQHDAQLRGPGGEPSAFEFSLHRLAFLSLLKREGQAAAVAYARQHFGRFRASQVGGEDWAAAAASAFALTVAADVAAANVGSLAGEGAVLAGAAACGGGCG
jgi:hypothetical protein